MKVRVFFKLFSCILCAGISTSVFAFETPVSLSNYQYVYDLSQYTPVDPSKPFPSYAPQSNKPVKTSSVSQQLIDLDEAVVPNSINHNAEDTFLSVLSDRQKKISSQWFKLVDNIDKKLSGDLYYYDESRENDSFLKLTLSETIDEKGSFTTDIRVRAKLDLPNTSKRWQLIFDSEDAIDETIEERLLDKELERTGLRLAALQWVTRQSKRWKDVISVGVRDFPPDPFIRYRNTYYQALKEHINLKIDNNVYYSREDNLRVSSSIEVVKALGDGRTLSNLTSLDWRDNSDILESVNATSYSRKLDGDRSYTYSGGVIGSNRPSSRTTNYFLRATYSKRVFQEWLYMDVSPLLEFPRASNFDVEPSLNLRLHAYFK